MQASERVIHDARDQPRWQAVVLIAQQANQAREGFPLDVVHDQKHAARIGVDLRDRNYVGMANARR
jgi:hypothetical protein